MARVFSTGDVADMLGQPLWHVLRIFEDGNVPEPPRVAGRRLIPGEMLPAIIDALEARGWLTPRAETAGAPNGQHEPRPP